MDDALRSRLDRLTWLVGALVAAVLALGYVQDGFLYLLSFGAILGVGGFVVVFAAALRDDFRRDSE